MDLVILVLCALGIVAGIYFYFHMKRSQKKLDKTFTDLKTKMKEREETEMRLDSKAIEKLKWEKDPNKAKRGLYWIFYRCSPKAGLEAYDIFMRRYQDGLTDFEKKFLLYKKANELHFLTRSGEGDQSTLIESRKIALELLRDEEVLSDPHFLLDVKRLLRHLALEERLKKGAG